MTAPTSTPASILRKTHPEKIEEGIVRALREGGLSAKYLIDSFPDNPDAFDIADAEKVALVQYTGSRYEAPEASGSGAQWRRAEFAIHLYLRRASTPVRGLREIEQIRMALQGLRLEGTELHITRDGLIDQEAALWRYMIELACRIPVVPLPHERLRPFTTDFNKTEG